MPRWRYSPDGERVPTEWEVLHMSHTITLEDAARSPLLRPAIEREAVAMRLHATAYFAEATALSATGDLHGAMQGWAISGNLNGLAADLEAALEMANE